MFQTNNQTDQLRNDIRRSVERWNFLYPLDKWYRDKYSIRYNSDEHRSIDIVDIRMEYEEEHLYRSTLIDIALSKKSTYIPGRGEWLQKQPEVEDMNKDQIDDLYDKVSIKDIDDDAEEIII